MSDKPIDPRIDKDGVGWCSSDCPYWLLVGIGETCSFLKKDLPWHETICEPWALQMASTLSALVESTKEARNLIALLASSWPATVIDTARGLSISDGFGVRLQAAIENADAVLVPNKSAKELTHET